MEKVKALIQHIAPALTSGLEEPFAGIATTFIIGSLAVNETSDHENPESIILNLLQNPMNPERMTDIDQRFQKEMKKLGIDIFSHKKNEIKKEKYNTNATYRFQVIISIFFLIAYFSMLAGMFFVEVSDSMNMVKGENSLMNLLEILLGVLTAGVGQILNYWLSHPNIKQS